MPHMSKGIPKFCEDLNTITLDNKGGMAQKFIDKAHVTDGRTLGIMASADHSTCIRNDKGTINNVIGEVNVSGKGSHFIVSLLI